MAFDFKKEYRQFYMAKNKPEIVNVPKANFIAIRGKGDPNEAGGAFWWQEGIDGVDYADKSSFNWISVIRLPDFVTEADCMWAVETVARKKLDCSLAEFMTMEEGLCVQIMHHGPFDDEPATVALMDAFLEQNGYVNDFSENRLHHEIYLSDARKATPEKWKTVIRHPIKKELQS